MRRSAYWIVSSESVARTNRAILDRGDRLGCQPDPARRRPYVVAVANPSTLAGVKYEQAKQFAAYLRDPKTQAWIADFGRGRSDASPLFFPVKLP